MYLARSVPPNGSVLPLITRLTEGDEPEMAIFVVVLDRDAPELFKGKINELYPLSYRYTDNVFFIEDDNIPETIANRLGIKVEDENQRTTTGAVFGLDGSYSGYTAKSLWDWLRRIEK